MYKAFAINYFPAFCSFHAAILVWLPSIPPAIRFIPLLHPVHIYQQDTLVIVHYLD